MVSGSWNEPAGENLPPNAATADTFWVNPTSRQIKGPTPCDAEPWIRGPSQFFIAGWGLLPEGSLTSPIYREPHLLVAEPDPLSTPCRATHHLLSAHAPAKYRRLQIESGRRPT